MATSLAWHSDRFNLPTLANYLGFTEAESLPLAEELLSQGYATLEGDSYLLTEKGRELARASAAGMIKRKTAEVALEGVLERVPLINADPEKVRIVAAVVVFGGYLRDGDKLGDLDLAVKIVDRNPHDTDRVATMIAYADKSGRRFSTFLDQFYWADAEILQILKARKRTISIQAWESFVGIAARDPVRVPYRVVFGNPMEVETEIRAKASEPKSEPHR